VNTWEAVGVQKAGQVRAGETQGEVRDSGKLDAVPPGGTVGDGFGLEPGLAGASELAGDELADDEDDDQGDEDAAAGCSRATAAPPTCCASVKACI
jgi:hypothetical protein